MIHIFTLINIELFCRYLSVSGVRVRGPGRFCRSVKESLNGPVQANRSDDTKSGIGTERKNIPGFRINMYINTFSFNPEITEWYKDNVSSTTYSYEPSKHPIYLSDYEA